MEKMKRIFKDGTAFLPLLLSVAATNLGHGVYKGILDNYLAEVVSMSGFGRGVAEFFRELPGLALVLILAALFMCSAETIYKIGAVVTLVGMALHAILPANMVMITLAICIYSLGDHMQLGMRNTLTLEYAQPGKSGVALGLQNSAIQIGSLVGLLIIAGAFLVLPNNEKIYRIFFWISAGISSIGMFASFAIKGKSQTDSNRRRFYFAKKYKKYYFLEVFYGARKQVFFTFGPYVLILFYGAKTTTMSLLFAVSAIVCFVASPMVGRIIDRLGYKTVMVADTLILVIVCFFYGFAHRIFPKDVAFVVCCVNYILDSVISLASMASNVYVQDISDNDEEMKKTLSTGISVNHLITVAIALFGGWIWETLGIETLFVLSAILGLCNSAYAASIKMKDGHALIEG